MFFSVYFHYQFRTYNALSFLLELLLLNKMSPSFSYDNHHTNFSSYFLNISLILWVQFVGLSHLLYSLHVLIKDIKSFIFLYICFWEWMGNLSVLYFLWCHSLFFRVSNFILLSGNFPCIRNCSFKSSSTGWWPKARQNFHFCFYSLFCIFKKRTHCISALD